MKFSTTMSVSATRRLAISSPAGLRRSSVMQRLLRASLSQLSVGAGRGHRPNVRIVSPLPGSSTLITSAPNSPRIVAQNGPASDFRQVEDAHALQRPLFGSAKRSCPFLSPGRRSGPTTFIVAASMRRPSGWDRPLRAACATASASFTRLAQATSSALGENTSWARGIGVGCIAHLPTNPGCGHAARPRGNHRHRRNCHRGRRSLSCRTRSKRWRPGPRRSATGRSSVPAEGAVHLVGHDDIVRVRAADQRSSASMLRDSRLRRRRPSGYDAGLEDLLDPGHAESGLDLDM